jgi:hypothetical protein
MASAQSERQEAKKTGPIAMPGFRFRKVEGDLRPRAGRARSAAASM